MSPVVAWCLGYIGMPWLLVGLGFALKLRREEGIGRGAFITVFLSGPICPVFVSLIDGLNGLFDLLLLPVWRKMLGVRDRLWRQVSGKLRQFAVWLIGRLPQ